MNYERYELRSLQSAHAVSTFDHVTPVYPSSISSSLSHHRLVLHPGLHRHRLDRSVVLCPPRHTSNATWFAHLRRPMPQLRAASTPVIPTSHTTWTTPCQSGPRKRPHIAGLAVLHCIELFRTLRTFLAPLSLRTPALALLPALST